MSVLHDLDCQQKACVRVMRHTRPSSISLYHSSRVPIGLRMAPDTDRIGVSQAGLPGLLLLAPCFSDNLLQLRQFLRAGGLLLQISRGPLAGRLALHPEFGGNNDETALFNPAVG
jgi:hypothetical protein